MYKQDFTLLAVISANMLFFFLYALKQSGIIKHFSKNQWLFREVITENLDTIFKKTENPRERVKVALLGVPRQKLRSPYYMKKYNITHTHYLHSNPSVCPKSSFNIQ